MTMASAVKDGVPSLRFETRDSASMLFRAVDIDLAAYPMLAWRSHSAAAAAVTGATDGPSSAYPEPPDCSGPLA